MKKQPTIKKLLDLSTDDSEFAVNRFGELVTEIKTIDPELFQALVNDGLITDNNKNRLQ